MVTFPIENLVFEGGGVKGIAYAGAVEALSERGQLEGVKRVAGTSVGAAVAALLALGAKSQEIQEAVGGMNPRAFADDDCGVLRDLRRLLKRYGWNRGDSFTEWFKEQMRAVAGSSEYTFADIRHLAARYHGEFRDLYIIGTNLSRQESRIFSAAHTPDMPVWKAVRISISIPLFFAAVEMDGEWWVDGGLTWNYPIDLFDRWIDGKMEVNEKTVGFRVGSRHESEYNHPVHPIGSLCDFGLVLAGYWQETANRMHMKLADWERTVFIEANGVRATDFDLSRPAARELARNGKEAVILALSRWYPG
jgi:NTE family protein